jgi:hypothetical protein
MNLFGPVMRRTGIPGIFGFAEALRELQVHQGDDGNARQTLQFAVPKIHGFMVRSGRQLTSAGSSGTTIRAKVLKRWKREGLY